MGYDETMKSTKPGVPSEEPITLKLTRVGDLYFPFTTEDSGGEVVEFKVHRSSARLIAAQILGSLTSPEKLKAARANGKKGGRPRREEVKSVADIRAEKAAMKAEKQLEKDRRAAVKNPKTALPLFPSDGLPATATPDHLSHSAPPVEGGLGGKRGRPTTRKQNPSDGLRFEE